MSFNITRRGDGLCVFGSTAWCDERGVVVSLASPMVVLPKHRALIFMMVRGETVAGIADDVCFQFEGLADVMPAILEKHRAALDRDYVSSELSSTIYVPGCAEGGSAEAHVY
jgi:hypothetical protein